MNKTTEYYEENAKAFIENTVDCDMSLQYNLLLKHLEKGATILDVGFGSARDMLKFKELGFDVCGIDVADRFVSNAKKFGLNVNKMSVLDIDYNNTFDGIWACASLLHLSKKELIIAFNKLECALKENGFIYMSFKLGDYEGYRNGRFFTDLTLDSFNKLVSNTNLRIIETLITKDVRPDREESWLNVVLTK